MKIGPVVTGTISEERPPTREERRTRMFLWWVTIFLVGTGSIPVALVLAALTVLYLLFRPVPTADERTTP